MFKMIFIITLLTSSACVVMNANAAPSSDLNNGLTLTPYGWVPKSRVIAVTQNESVGTSPEGNAVLKDMKTGSIIREFPIVPTKKIDLPNVSNPGYLVTDGFGDDVLVFSTEWTVPKAPKNPRADVTFYIFSGLDNGLIKSVLQWGNGSASYMISNWADINGYFFHGPYISVLPGDLLKSASVFQTADKNGWHFKQIFVDYPVDLSFTLPLPPTKIAIGFEPHTTNLDELPASQCTKMKQILLVDMLTIPTINWKVGGIPLPTPSGKNTVIVNNSSSHGEIDFYYH